LSDDVAVAAFREVGIRRLGRAGQDGLQTLYVNPETGDLTYAPTGDAVIRAYDEHKVSFRALLDRLEECAAHIADDTEWQESFRLAWDGMEQPYP
jgi:hypothetical protein